MSGYVIANIDVKNPEAYKEYIRKVKTIVIKFPTYEKALEWYNSEEYKPVKPIRLENTVTNGIIIKGAEDE